MSLPFIRYLLRALKIDIWVVFAVATAATLLQRSPIRISTTANRERYKSRFRSQFAR